METHFLGNESEKLNRLICYSAEKLTQAIGTLFPDLHLISYILYLLLYSITIISYEKYFVYFNESPRERTTKDLREKQGDNFAYCNKLNIFCSLT